MPRKRKNFYFTQDTENAILEYKEEDNPIKKEVIYTTRIHKAFDKLAENIINNHRFYQINLPFNDIKHMVVTFLIDKIPNYEKDKGKAYSYFNIIGRNFLIAENIKAYRKKIQHEDIYEVSNKNENDFIYEIEDTFDDLPLDKFFTQFTDHIYQQLDNYFPEIQDRPIVEAILDFFKNCDSIEIFNKKALYFIVRERTSVPTSKISKIVKKLKLIFKEVYPCYLEEGKIRDKNYLLL